MLLSQLYDREASLCDWKCRCLLTVITEVSTWWLLVTLECSLQKRLAKEAKEVEKLRKASEKVPLCAHS